MRYYTQKLCQTVNIIKLVASNELQKIIKRAVPYIRALIVLPTRELALQVYKVLKQLTKDTKLKSHILAGASDFPNVS